MAGKSSNNGWLVTIGVSAAIAIVATKYCAPIKEMLKDVPVIGDWVNS